jgi:hypothetical protein
MTNNETRTNPDLERSSGAGGGTRHKPGGHAEEMEEYAGGYIKARHGKVNAWLIVVIVVLIVWAVYYGFAYWGGLGSGLDY